MQPRPLLTLALLVIVVSTAGLSFGWQLSNTGSAPAPNSTDLLCNEGRIICVSRTVAHSLVSNPFGLEVLVNSPDDIELDWEIEDSTGQVLESSSTYDDILNLGRKWGYAIPNVEKRDIVFPADKKPQPQVFFFDAEIAARVINLAPYPFKLMFLIAAVCGLRIGEVTALKVGNIDFKRKVLRVTGALDYATRKESTPKSDNSAGPVHMSELLAKHLRNWLDKRYVANVDGYLFTNSKGKPYLSVSVVKYGIHRAMEKLGIETAKGVHVGVHAFRHGVTSELLESGTPIHVVTRLMRHADSNVTLAHYAHIVGDAERVASEKFSQRIGQNITQLDSDSELESTSSVKTA